MSTQAKGQEKKGRKQEESSQNTSSKRASSTRASIKSETTASHASFASSIPGHLRSISRELFLAASSSPRKDPAFAFPYNAFEQAVSNAFRIDGISCSQESSSQWLEAQEAQEECIAPKQDLLEVTLKGLESAPLIVSVPSLVYDAFFEALFGRDAFLSAKEDSDFLSRFRSFVLLQMLGAIRSVPELQSLGIAFSKIIPEEERASTPFSPCYRSRACLQIGENAASISCYTSSAFLSEWASLHQPSLDKELSSLAQTITTPISIEMGRSFIHAKELAHMRPGDIFIVEHPFYTPNSEKARVILTHRGKPVFRAKFKEGEGLKILEMPIHPEVFTYIGGVQLEAQPSLNEQIPDKEMPEKEIKEMSEEEAVMEDTQANEPSYDKDELDIGENPFEGEDPEEGEEEESSQQVDIDSDTIDKSKSYLPPEKVDISKIPHTVVVQLAQLNMTLDELAKLSPGHVIDLSLRPQDPVSLVIGNTVIAIGEMVVIGDHVGVRIHDIGFTSEEDSSKQDS